MARDLGELSPLALAARRLNVMTRQAARLAAWRLARSDYPAPALPAGERFPHLLYARSLPLARAGGHPLLEAGKEVNLALAAPHLDGLLVAPERPFSFWRAVPRPTAARGYRHGMELRGGCIVPSLGGGLCLLSNALFAAAAQLGWRILERHGHTMAVAGADPLDATVFWPHVDLRFAPRAGCALLRVRVRDGVLAVAIWSDRPAALAVDIAGDQTAAGSTVTSAIRRVVRDQRGALLEDAFVALDHKRLVDPAAATRSCLTCDRPCHARRLP
jgi:vancomycin resistance protein VanW